LQDYIVNYWSRSGAQLVNGSSSSIQGRTVNGWTYYEHSIHNPSGGTVAISNTGTIDELRLYPTTAMMKSFTHIPQVGISSVSDENGKILYYEYDEYSRLFLIRDEKKNILKKYCYNYSGEPEKCSGSTSALWNINGLTRCKKCEQDTTFYSTVRQVQQIDNNPLSATYGQPRWADIGIDESCLLDSDWQFTTTSPRCEIVDSVYTGSQEKEKQNMNPCSPFYNQTKWVFYQQNCTSCPPPPQWNSIGNERCVLDSNSNYTGYKERQERDINPCSATYWTTRWFTYQYSPTECSSTGCNSYTCTGEGYKCINGVCEQGIKVYTHSELIDEENFIYRCTYHYEFSDNTWSENYQENSSEPCL
jgi:hypothetical protein